MTFRPQVEQLESREVPYAVSGAWTDNHITYSFVPDGTMFNGQQSTLFAYMDSQMERAIWQGIYRDALNTWAEVANIEFEEVADGGQPVGTIGLKQGDSRFGDIRFGSIADEPDAILSKGYAPTASGTKAGDTHIDNQVGVNQWVTFNGETWYRDLYSLVLHEIGHTIGMNHVTQNSVMISPVRKVVTGLLADDINGIRNLYGARPASGETFLADMYEAFGGNNSSATATNLGTITFASLTANDHSVRDVDYYKFKAATTGYYTVAVDGSATINSTTAKVNRFLLAGQTYTFSVRAAAQTEYYLAISKDPAMIAQLLALEKQKGL